jgi:hypothetical protein
VHFITASHWTRVPEGNDLNIGATEHMLLGGREIREFETDHPLGMVREICHQKDGDMKDHFRRTEMSDGAAHPIK